MGAACTIRVQCKHSFFRKLALEYLTCIMRAKQIFEFFMKIRKAELIFIWKCLIMVQNDVLMLLIYAILVNRYFIHIKMETGDTALNM